MPHSSPNRRQVALVTGANRGLGFEIVRQLAGHGMLAVVAARDGAKGAAAAASLQAEGREVAAVALDVDDAGSVRDGIAETIGRFGRIDVLVNNAGVLLDGPDAQTASILELPPEALTGVIRQPRSIGPAI